MHIFFCSICHSRTTVSDVWAEVNTLNLGSEGRKTKGVREDITIGVNKDEIYIQYISEDI